MDRARGKGNSMTARTKLMSTLEEESRQWCHLLAGTIIRVRKERGLSQRKLGGKVGLSQSAISLLESDPDSAHVGRLYGTLRALGLDLVVQPLAHADLPLVRRRRSDRAAANDKLAPLLDPAA